MERRRPTRMRCLRPATGLHCRSPARGLASIAFPSISTGIYGFPADRAAKLAVATVSEEMAVDPGVLARVVFCCFDMRAAELHQAAIAEGERV